MLYEIGRCIVAGLIGGTIVSTIWFGIQVVKCWLRRRRQ
jgi:hypothetical protein